MIPTRGHCTVIASVGTSHVNMVGYLTFQMQVIVNPPFVLLPDEVLRSEVHQVNHGLARDEQMTVQLYDLHS